MIFTDRFWSNVDVRNPDECWPWKRACYPDGYGMVGIRNQGRNTTMRANALALILSTGEDANGRYALHRCDNPVCCNPGHLWWGTQLDNIRDMDAKGRRVRRGSPGESHPNVKLTDLQVVAIRMVWSTGMFTQQQIADDFGVAQFTISAIVRNKSRVGSL